MLLKILYLMVLFGKICLVKGSFYPASSGVINLDAGNFDESIGVNDYDVSIVEFYAPWCGHCQSLKPEYVKAAQAMKGIVQVFAVDANEDKNKPLAQKFQIQGFPTIKVFVGTQMFDYNGERTANGLKNFAFEKLPSFVKKLTDKTVDKFIQKDKDEKPRALILSKKDITSPTVKRLSALTKDHIPFGEVGKAHAKQIAKKYDITIGESSVLLIFPKGNTETPQMFSGNTKSFTELQTFLYSFTEGLKVMDKDQLPILADESCFQEKCMKKGLCVILIRGEDEEDAKKTHNILKEIQEQRDDASLFAFSQIDGTKEKEQVWLKTLFGELNTLYSNIIIFAPVKKRYAQYVGTFNVQAVASWVSGVLSGSTRTAPIANAEIPKLSTETELCKPKPKPKPQKKNKENDQQSAQRPGDTDWKSAQPGAGSPYLLHLNPNNFQKLILESNQPAIVEFYAPWCGHCKSLAPHFAKAATNLKGMVLFAGVDCNEESNRPLCAKYGVQGFPTLKVFPAGKASKAKEQPKDYMGQRTAQALEQEATDTLYRVKVPTLAKNKDFDDFINKNKQKARILLITEKNKPPTMLRALAAKFDDITFAVMQKQKEITERLGVSTVPAVIVYTGNSEEKDGLEYTGNKTFEEMNTFVEQLLNGNINPNSIKPILVGSAKVQDASAKAEAKSAEQKEESHEDRGKSDL